MNFKTDLLVLLNLLNDAVEGYMIFQNGPRCLSIKALGESQPVTEPSNFPRSATLLWGTISY